MDDAAVALDNKSTSMKIKGRFSIVPTIKDLTKLGLTHAETKVYLALLSYRNSRNGRAWPTQETLAKELGYSSKSGTRTLRNHIKALDKKGAICVYWHVHRGQRHLNYTFPPLDGPPPPDVLANRRYSGVGAQEAVVDVADAPVGAVESAPVETGPQHTGGTGAQHPGIHIRHTEDDVYRDENTTHNDADASDVCGGSSFPLPFRYRTPDEMAETFRRELVDHLVRFGVWAKTAPSLVDETIREHGILLARLIIWHAVGAVDVLEARSKGAVIAAKLRAGVVPSIDWLKKNPDAQLYREDIAKSYCRKLDNDSSINLGELYFFARQLRPDLDWSRLAPGHRPHSFVETSPDPLIETFALVYGYLAARAACEGIDLDCLDYLEGESQVFDDWVFASMLQLPSIDAVREYRSIAPMFE